MIDEKKALQAATMFLEAIGENPNRTGLVDTPKRMVKMYSQVFRGYNDEELPEITHFPNGEDGIKYNSMVLDIGYFFSYCEHHVVPFFGNYAIAYMPDKHVAGASKFARTIDHYASRLQVQERIGIQVLDRLESVIRPKGCILVLNARHLCKEMRGVMKYNSPFETIEARGVFRTNENNVKDEFMSRIQGKI